MMHDSGRTVKPGIVKENKPGISLMNEKACCMFLWNFICLCQDIDFPITSPRMNFRFFILLIFFGIQSALAFPIPSAQDSLIQVTRNDSILRLANWYFVHEKYNAALREYFSVIEYQKKIDDRISQIQTYSKIIEIFTTISNWELAKKYVDLTMEIGKTIKDDPIRVYPYIFLGNYYMSRHEYDTAIYLMYLHMPLILETKSETYERAFYFMLGDVFNRKKDFGMSAFYYEKAILMYQKDSVMSTLASLYTRMGNIYWSLGMNDRVLRYNLMALRIREKLGDDLVHFLALINAGDGYYLMNRRDSALYYYQTALDVVRDLDRPYYKEVAYRFLKNFVLEEGRYKEALEYDKNALAYRLEYSIEKTRSEITIIEANQSILDREFQNQNIRQENLIQKLKIRNSNLMTIALEICFLSCLSMIFVVDFLIRNNRKKKYQIITVNNRLLRENKENMAADQKLRETEALHRFLVENTLEILSLVGSDLHVSYISSSCFPLLGYTSTEILQSGTISMLIDEECRESFKDHILMAQNEEKPVRCLFKAVRKDGTTFWAEATISRAIDPLFPDIKEIMAVIRDVSERIKFEEEISGNARQKELLLNEIHNRVKNNFAILGSLIHLLTSYQTEKSLTDSMVSLMLRIRTMSLVHELLYKSHTTHSVPFDIYLQDLCMIVAGTFHNDRIKIRTDICSCTLSIEMTLPIGLIVSELHTNAFKYAFPGEKNGTITVSLEPLEQDRYRISVRDDGIGLPEHFKMETTPTMGTRIVSILVEQIEGNLSVINHEGTCFRIDFTVTQPT